MPLIPQQAGKIIQISPTKNYIKLLESTKSDSKMSSSVASSYKDFKGSKVKKKTSMHNVQHPYSRQWPQVEQDVMGLGSNVS